jgi:YebC/PmpR family DNA-binding regulatory protein
LRLAIERARAQNMPKENIERAIKRGTGESKEGNTFEEITYEGYAPHGIAVIVQVVTDNKNRSVSEIRHALSRSGGILGEAGSVTWQFTRTANFTLPVKGNDFDKIFELAVDGGANDVVQEGESIEIIAPVESFKIITDKLRSSNVQIEDAGLQYTPNQEIELEVDQTLQVMRALEGIEELDDVQNVYSNLKISDEAMASLESE